MNKVKLLPVLGFVVVSLLAGCAKNERFQAIERVCIPGVGRRTAFETAQQVLGEMQFRIDKADAFAGYIKTKPLGAAQLFELWRSDNVGGSNNLEANLHSLRRVAELQMNQTDNQFCINCQVKTYRLSLPESGHRSISLAYKTFSKSLTSLEKFQLSDEQKRNMAWVELGEDKKLATEILKRLKKEIAEKSEGK